ncbi:MAG: HAD family phosphatase [Lentisphaerae bacterium]|nr:HAD family phosphatase [Lentisphaerota bacterium]
MSTKIQSVGGGALRTADGLVPLESGAEGRFRADVDGVRSILATADGRAEFILFDEHTLAWVKSEMGYPAIYPVHPVHVERPIEAVLMDLDGTTVRSEDFWVWIIEQTTAQLLGDPSFRLQPEDAPFVSGHSVSEHLQHCINKYAQDHAVEEARAVYFTTTRREMQAILEGHGKSDAFKPSPGVRSFLLALRERRIKIGLVTSGLYEKAWPEIVSAFQTMGLGDPVDFYDAIVTAGFPLRKGEAGTLGELSPKPHPWLYAEVARIGLGIPFERRHRVLGIEDSGAGVVSIRLAGFATVGMADGNLVQSGTKPLVERYCETFEDVLAFIDG